VSLAKSIVYSVYIESKWCITYYQKCTV